MHDTLLEPSELSLDIP